MSITVFHSLTATTPDNTQYEIRPSHWNSNHIVSLSLGGSDLSGAFSNSPTVTFGTSGGLMTASVFTNYAATNITTNAIALSNSSLFQQTSATSAITSAAFASANSSLLIAVSNSSLFQQTSATSAITSAAFASANSSLLIAVSNSSLFQQTSATSAITSNAFATSNSSLLIATSNSSLFQQTSATSAITSAAFPSAQTTKFAGTGTTFSGTNVSGSMTLNSNGLNLALSAGAGGGGNFSAGISTGGNTSGNTGTVSNQIVFVGGNNVTLSGSTGAGGATVTISGANAGGAQTGISGVVVSNTTYTSGTFSFRDGNNISFASGTGQGVSITHNLQSAGAYLTTAMQSNAGSNFLGTNTALTANGVSVTANSSGLSLNFPAFLTTAMQSNAGSNFLGTNTALTANGVSVTANSSGLSLNFPAFLTTAMQSQSSSVFAKTGFTSASTAGTAIVATHDTAGLSMGIPAYITTFASQTAQTANLYATGANTTQLSSTAGVDLRSISISGAGAASAGVSGGIILVSAPPVSVLSGLGNITVGTTGSTIGISGGGGGGGSFSAGISTGGNTSGNTGTVSNQIVFVGGNNVTLSGSTGAGGATVTISGANIGGAQTGISGIGAGTQTQTSGTVIFSNSGAGNIAFGLSNGTITASVTGAYLTTAMQSNAGSNFLGTNTALTANGVSVTANSSGLSLNFPAFLTTAAQSSASNVSQIIAGTASAGGTATLTGGVSFSNANGISFFTSAGNAIVATVKTDYLTTAMQSNAGSNFLGTNTALTANGVSVTANSSGLSLNFPAFLTTAAQSSASNVSAIVAGTASNGGTTTLAGAVSFSNANGVSFYTSAGGAVVATVKTDYLTTAMQSNAGSNFLGTNTALTANGVSVTANSSGLSLNFPAFLTTAMQSQSSSVFAKTGFTSTTTAGTAIVATHDTNGLSMGIPAFITAAGGVQTAISGMALSNTTYTSGTVSFRDGNNISFASGTGQGISITHNLQSAGNYLTTAMQSQSSSVFAKTGFTSTTTAGTAIVATHDTNGLSMGIPAYITTAPSTAGLISAINVSAGTTSNNLSAITFANTGNVTFGMAGSVITASAPSGGGGGGVAIAASNTTFTSGTVVMSAAGGALTISSGAQSVLLSVPQTSSIVAASGVALSTNGSTIYLYNDFHDIFVPNNPGATTTASFGNGVLVFAPLYPVDNYTFTCFDMNVSIPSASAATSSQQGAETLSFGLYRMDTANASQMTLVNSSSMFVRMSASSNVSAAYTVNFNNSATSYSSTSGGSAVLTEFGNRYVVMRVPFNGSFQAGEVYFFGMNVSHTFTNQSSVMRPIQFVGAGAAPANTTFGYFGPDTRNVGAAMDYMGFSYTTTSGAFPNTISTNQTAVISVSSAFVPFLAFKNLV